MKAKHYGAGVILSVALLTLAGCGGGGSGGAASPSAPAASAPAASAPATSDDTRAASKGELKVATTNLGEIVVADNGLTVYYFTKDVKDSGVSNCTGECLVAWPPVLTTDDTPSAEGVTGQVGTIPTPDGKMQVTINGMPIYFWKDDKAPGDMTGQGVNGVWYVVAPNGDMIQ